jgi:hypothetical protein
MSMMIRCTGLEHSAAEDAYAESVARDPGGVTVSFTRADSPARESTVWARIRNVALPRPGTTIQRSGTDAISALGSPVRITEGRYDDVRSRLVRRGPPADPTMSPHGVVIDAATARVAVRGRCDGVPAGKDEGRAHDQTAASRMTSARNRSAGATTMCRTARVGTNTDTSPIRSRSRASSSEGRVETQWENS